MYNDTVTIFNHIESTESLIWYPHVISGVNLNTDKGWMLKKYGADCVDNAQLHIAYTIMDGVKVIKNSSGQLLPWLSPKEWKRQNGDLLNASITFEPGNFFWNGVWTGGIVSDEEYQDRRNEGFYSYMNNEHDNVYLISSVSSFSVIPHFEILAR